MLNSAADTLDWNAEAVLDPAIGFHNPLSKNWREPKSIFLTGATGLLGAYLLDELLQKITVDVYCLVRCSDAENGKQRLKAHLEFYSLWQEAFRERIIPVVGDLSLPLFGLSEEQFSELAGHIDVIYHNGAQLDFVSPYSKLKATNVLGTQEILRLASLIQTKPVHFVSTIGVFASQVYSQVQQFTETDLPSLYDPRDAYRQSKCVAEELVRIANQRGLPTCIYRPSRVMGHSRTGIYGKFKNFWVLLRACIELGKFPGLAVELNIVPVDYVSQVIVHLSQQEKFLGKAFHVINPQPIDWKKLFAGICSLGYFLEEVTYDEWLVEIKHYASGNPDKNVLASLIPMLVNTVNTIRSQQSQFDIRHTIEGLMDTSIVCPPVDTQLIPTYFSYFQKNGYMPVP